MLLQTALYCLFLMRYSNPRHYLIETVEDREASKSNPDNGELMAMKKYKCYCTEDVDCNFR